MTFLSDDDRPGSRIRERGIGRRVIGAWLRTWSVLLFLFTDGSVRERPTRGSSGKQHPEHKMHGRSPSHEEESRREDCREPMASDAMAAGMRQR